MISEQLRGTGLHLTLAGLNAHGMFDQAFLVQLRDAIVRAPEDPNVRAIVITNTGPVFCRGGNVGSGAQARRLFADAFCNVLDAIALSPLPVISAINGVCTAGGMTLLAATDYSVCVKDAKFGYPELAIGAFPMLATVTAPRHLPKSVFFEMAYTCEMMTAEAAQRAYIVNDIVDDEAALNAATDTFCAMLSTRSKESITAGRGLYYETVGRPDRLWLANAVERMVGLPELPHYR